MYVCCGCVLTRREGKRGRTHCWERGGEQQVGAHVPGDTIAKVNSPDISVEGYHLYRQKRTIAWVNDSRKEKKSAAQGVTPNHKDKSGMTPRVGTAGISPCCK